jgi:hypothetical protein
VPDWEKEGFQPVRIKIGKTKNKWKFTQNLLQFT